MPWLSTQNSTRTPHQDKKTFRTCEPFFILLSFLFYSDISQSQPISIGNSSNRCRSPYYPFVSYSYAQSIYLEQEIQASGNITSLTFYYNGTSLSNSDSPLIWIGITDKDYFGANYQSWFPLSSMTKVFDTVLTNYVAPGAVTINLQTPLSYSGVGNIVVAMNDTRANWDNGWFLGTNTHFGAYGRVLMVDGGFSPIDPNNPPLAAAYGDLANITINGLTLLPCQSPKNIRFTNITYNAAKVNWSPAELNATPSGYDIYYSTSRTKPIATSTPSDSTATPADTSKMLTGLSPSTKYYAWVRSKCSSVGEKSVWTVIDSFTTGINTPVTLMEFTGKQQATTNLLHWRTATEQNNKGFELQRSINSTEFSPIAFVPTKASGGNSNSILSYSYTDTKPFAGNNYYRLKQVDYDGKSTLSNVVLIKGEATQELVLSALYPNPTKDKLYIQLQTRSEKQVTVLITDIAGKALQQQTLQLLKGNNNKSLNVAALQQGTYILKLICSNGCEAAVSKFVKE